MSSTIGSTSQVSANIIQNNGQRNTDQTVRREQQQPSQTTVQATKSAENYQKIAEDIIAKRASGQAQQQSPIRGQVVDLLV